MSENSKIPNYGHRPYLAPATPNTPLEICVPDTVQLPETPTFAGKTISFLMAAEKDINTIEYAEDEGEINSSDEELKQFLLSVEETKMMGKLLAHCKSILFAVGNGGALGHMTCIQQGRFYSFRINELSALPYLKWEIQRVSQLVNGDL